MTQQLKIARWVRQLPTPHSEDDPADGPFVVQHLFKLFPPMAYSTMVEFRKGRLLPDDREASLRRLSRNLVHGEHHAHSYRQRTTAFVVVSASDLKTYMEASMQKLRPDMKFSSKFEVETYIFPACKDGRWKPGGELEGSERGHMDHRRALANAGYRVVGMPRPLELGVTCE